MANINFNQLLKDCLGAAENHLKDAYQAAKPFAEQSFKQFAEDALFLAKLRLANEIDDNELKHRLDNQKIALANVLLAVKGIGLIEAQDTINEVFGFVSDAIFGAIKVALPI